MTWVVLDEYDYGTAKSASARFSSVKQGKSCKTPVIPDANKAVRLPQILSFVNVQPLCAPPTSVVFADELSMIAAVGVGSLSAAIRT